jgi:hypothetical protein
VERPGFGPVNEHVSDRASERWAYDHRLDNDGEVGSLHGKVRQLIGELRVAEGEKNRE